MKICTVIMTYDTPLYSHFDKIKRNYLNKKNEDFYFLYNGTDTSLHNIEKRQINYFCNTPHPAGIPTMFHKFMHLIESGLLNDYDYVIRCNSSTFVNIDMIREKIKTASKELFMGYFDPGWDFVSGTCIIFSKNILQQLFNYRHKANVYIEDDVAIGRVLTSMGIQKTHVDMYLFTDRQKLPDDDEIKQALTYPLVRIRNEPNRLAIDTGIWDKISNYVITK